MTADYPQWPDVPKELAGMTWREVSRAQLRAQMKVARGEELDDDERRVWEFHFPPKSAAERER